MKSYYQDKKILLAHWDSENKLDNASMNWYSPLKKIFGKVITFSPKKNYFIYGRKIMNQKFLDLIAKERPDFIFFLLIYDEFDPNIFMDIKKKFPDIKMVTINSDDVWRFEDFYRYYSLFFDYILSASICALPFYKKDGIKNVLFSCGVNTEHLRPFNLKKKCDVVFIGRPGPERVDYLRFLIKRGIKVDIWGAAWDSYPEFKKFYHGTLSIEDWPKVVSQGKINLSFSIGGNKKAQFKGRPIEVSACKSFSLIEYCKDYLDIFNKDEIIMFKNKEDLFKKINHYLVHDDEREKIAENAYRKTIKKYNVTLELFKMFNMIKNKKKKKFVLSLSKKVKYISVSDFEDIKNKLKDCDYVCFKTDSSIHPLKDYFQTYSLEKSGKDISCCDYYVNSPTLGNYLLFKPRQSFDKIGKKANYFINPAQLMVKKSYFLKHLDLFRHLLKGKNAEVIKNNVVFVSIPLVEVKEVKILNNEEMENSFQMKFLDHLYSLYIQKKVITFQRYLISLIIEILKGKWFIFNTLKKALTDKSKLSKLKGI